MEELISLEIGLTPSAVRMIKSYCALSSRSMEETTSEIGILISDALELQLKAKIAAHLGIDTTPAPVKPTRRTAAVAVQPQYTDTTGISEGLGDDDPEESLLLPAETSETALVPTSGGVTEKELDEDLDVTDPNSEAASEGGTWSEQMAGGDAVDNMFVEAINSDPAIDNRKGKQKHKRSLGKGKVSALTHAPSERE